MIPQLADRYRVVAPDYPGFGPSDAPATSDFAYMFDHLSAVIEAFVEALEVEAYVPYIRAGPQGPDPLSPRAVVRLTSAQAKGRAE